MKYLLLLSCLLLLTCVEEAVVETTVLATVEKVKDTIAVSQVVPEPVVPPPLAQSLSEPKCPVSISVIVGKTNKVLYLGVDNVVEIKGTGYDPKELKVTASGASIESLYPGRYYAVEPDEDSQVLLTVSTLQGGVLGQFPLYVSRVPDATIMLQDMTSGNMLLSRFIATKGVYTVIINSGLEVQCSVVGFQMRQITQDGLINAVLNQGDMFTSETLELVNAASPGDIYIIDRTTYSCPGDQLDRKGNTLVFDII